jgi:tetratricopeptide (TPR) repeat protein
MNATLGKALGLHRALWEYDAWYRYAWLAAPQALSIAALFLVLSDAGAPPAAPWVKPMPSASQTNPDFQPCMSVGDLKKRGEACDRLIKSGRLSGNELAEAYFGRGLMNQSANQVDAAIADYSEALKLNPRHSVAASSRGGQYLSKNDFANAEKDIDNAIETSGSNRAALALAIAFKAELRRAQGRLAEAQKEIDRALEIQKDFPFGQSVRDSIQADVKRAEEKNRKPPPQVKEDPSDALRKRALADLQKGDHDMALAQFNELILSGSQNSSDYANRGTAYAGKRQFDLAMEDFNRAIGLNPHSWYPHLKRGEIYAQRGDQARAMTDFNAGIKDHNGNDSRLFYQRGRIYLRQEAYSSALADFDKVVELEPNYAEGYMWRAQASAGEMRGIMENCRRSQSNQGGRQVIGGPCSMRMSFDTALADLRTAIAKKPDLAAAHYEIGRIMFDLSRWEEAIDAFSDAIRAWPNYADAYNYRGICNGKLQRRDRAVADFSDAIRIDPRNTAALANRGEMRESAGQRRQAIEDFRQAYEVDRQYAPAVNGLKRLGVRL